MQKINLFYNKVRKSNKKVFVLLVLFAALYMLSGCAKKKSDIYAVNNKNSVDKVLKEKTSPKKTHKKSASVKDGTKKNTDTQKNVSGKKSKKFDYDLTNMNSDMVYATVFQMMMEPEAFKGKKIKLKGVYYSGKDKKTKRKHHFCIIKDALQCCAQGIEILPDNKLKEKRNVFPKQNKSITVAGVAETYRIKGDKPIYCRIKASSVTCD